MALHRHPHLVRLCLPLPRRHNGRRTPHGRGPHPGGAALQRRPALLHALRSSDDVGGRGYRRGGGRGRREETAELLRPGALGGSEGGIRMYGKSRERRWCIKHEEMVGC